MNCNLREAACALAMTEHEVLWLVREGSLPACRINDQYLFNQVELQVWGAERNRKMAPDVLPPNAEPPQMLSLAGAIERGGVHYDIAGSTRNAVAHLRGIPAHVDREFLHVETPIVLLCLLAQDVEFKAIDQRPVRVLFTLLSPTISLHLRLLSRLTHTLHDDVLCQLLAESAAHDAILTRIRALEIRMNGSAPVRRP